MKEYRCVLEVESPVMISENRGTGHLLSGVDHIPGRSLIGALAELYEPHEFEEHRAAHRIFVQGGVQFGPLYPCLNGALSEPIPLSAFSCKFDSGFTTKNRPGHGVVDGLLIEPLPDRCFKCGAPLEVFGGYFTRSRGEMYLTVKPRRRRIAHTAISIPRQVADPGKLFTYEVLDVSPSSPRAFAGTVITGDPGLISDLNKRLEQRGRSVLLGKARSRGYGKVKVKPITEEVKQGDHAFQNRLNGLNERAEQKGKAVNAFYVSITLKSEAIMLDPFLRYRGAILPQDLAAATNVADFEQFEMVRAYTAVHQVRGWNRSTRLPLEDEIAIARGSCFLYRFDGNALSDEVKQALEGLEKSGIGERIQEGFGRLRVSDPFHWSLEVM